MPGISHASFQQKNYLLVYHILEAFFSRPEPIYRGDDTGRADQLPYNVWSALQINRRARSNRMPLRIGLK